jgi:predicted DNA-binding transcriptional regulator YafY
MVRRAERLFRLVNEMRTRGISRAEDLAAHFEISIRTIYRDIAHLQASGLPIEGEAGVGYLLRPGFHLPALTFTFEQLDALAVGLAFVEAAGDPSLSEAAIEVKAKLQASLPDPGQRRLENAPMFASRRDGPAAPLLKVVRQAIRDSRVLELSYTDASANASLRRVRPLAIWAFTDGWLFLGWCELRQDFRAFRLDRIALVKMTSDKFEDTAGQNLAAYMATKFEALYRERPSD